jgi:hypothetical protein
MGWFDRQVDSYLDRKIDKYVDDEFDTYLRGKVGDDTFRHLKSMARKGKPLEPDTEEALREELGDNFETYKTIHNGVAEMEQADSTLKQIARFLP